MKIKEWKRKLLPKHDQINFEIYNLLIKKSDDPIYIATILQIIIYFLTVNRIRIGKFLLLKVKARQLETLAEKNWILINQLKKDLINHKTFLTSKGKK